MKRLRDFVKYTTAFVAVSCTFYGENPCDDTAYDLQGLKSCITEFSILEGRYPDTLDELIGGKFLATNQKHVFVDPWGRRYSYRRLDEGFELFSNGSDGVPYTNDDIYPGRAPGICRPPGIINRFFANFSCEK